MKFEFIDPICVADDLATKLALVEDLGGVFRFSFVAEMQNELVLIRRICLLTTAVPDGMRMTAAIMAQSTNPAIKAMRVHH